MAEQAVDSRRILSYMHEREGDIIALIRSLVEIESPTSDKAAVDRMGTAVANAVEDIAKVTRLAQSEHGDHLRIQFDIPTKADGQVLGLGHIDTVWKIGTLQRMPWKQADGRLWGPGVFDMKAGVAYLVFAARALRELGLEARRRFVVQLNSDEEIGSPSSTPQVRKEAAQQRSRTRGRAECRPTGQPEDVSQGRGNIRGVGRGSGHPRWVGFRCRG